MNPPGNLHKDAFTRVELIVIVLVVLVLAGVLLPQLARARRTAQLSACEENLKQISLAHLLWVNEHERPVFPGQISTNRGGTMEYLQKGELFRHFQSLSNELVDFRLFVCPSDDRQAAKDFARLSNSNLSYFMNGSLDSLSGGLGPLDRRYYTIDWIALGDRNITNSAGERAGIAIVDRNQRVGWSGTMHNKGRQRSTMGNVAYIEGTVRKLTSAQLQAKNNVTNGFYLLGPYWSTSSPPSFPLYVP